MSSAESIGLILLILVIVITVIIRISHHVHDPTTKQLIKPSQFSVSMDSRIPPSHSTPLSSITTFHHARTSSGQNLMKRSKLVIAGLIRDAARQVPEMIARIEAIGQSFAEYQVLVVENDSQDNTRERLVAWKQRNPRVHILGCTDEDMECILNLPPTRDHEPWRHRIAKMAYLRNLYVDYLRQNLPNYDYLLVMDLDISGHFYLEGLADSFSYFETFPEIEAMGANGIRWAGRWMYYDPFAYLELSDPPEWRTLDEKQAHDYAIFSRPIMSLHDPVYQVQSCFAGAAVYRLSVMRASRYDYSRTGYACEHAYFNRGFKMYLNPAMLFEIWEH